MKQLLFITVAAATCVTASAQVLTEGKILFERTSQMSIRVAGGDEALANMIPKSKTDRFELIFGENQSLWKRVDDEGDNGEMSGGSGGVQFRMIMPGSDDVLYYNFTSGRKTEKRELLEKSFLVQDSITRLDWKLGNDAKTILGYNCKKATAQRIQSSFRVIADNGNTKREKITDTLEIVAWYTTDIPNFGGPDSYQGQLPGLVLEVNVGNGRTTYVAKEITGKINKSDIKEPKGGKKLTEAEFKMEQQKMMEDMQRGGGGQFKMKKGD